MLHVLYEAKPYSTARVNCADEFHTLGRRVIRRVYTIFLRARSKQMRDSCAFRSFLCITWLCEQKTFRFERAASRQRKIYIIYKAIMLHSRMSRRFANLLNKEK